MVEGHIYILAINIEHNLKYLRFKRTIRAKKFEDSLIVEKSLNNNSKCFDPIYAKKENYKHSFYVRTVLAWNKLSERVVKDELIQCFKILVAMSDK